jgi:hypothetical protein
MTHANELVSLRRDHEKRQVERLLRPPRVIPVTHAEAQFSPLHQLLMPQEQACERLAVQCDRLEMKAFDGLRFSATIRKELPFDRCSVALSTKGRPMTYSFDPSATG